MLLKFISVRFMDINLVKNAINGGKSRQNWSYLVKMFQIGIILEAKRHHRSIYGESGQTIYV